MGVYLVSNHKIGDGGIQLNQMELFEMQPLYTALTMNRSPLALCVGKYLCVLYLYLEFLVAIRHERVNKVDFISIESFLTNFTPLFSYGKVRI